MDADQIWAVIDAQRADLADVLESLTRNSGPPRRCARVEGAAMSPRT